MIAVDSAWKDWPGRPGALKGVTLRVASGERVALVGPNGSGKTTLIRILLGMASCRGSVRIAGCDPIREHAAAQTQVAYVPQRAPALPAPVREVVGFLSRTRGLPAEPLIAAARSFQLDLGAVWSQRFTGLSGGMQQKLLAAMALATECPILVLDEPTANLDPSARQSFFDLLGARRPPPTVILSSHRLDEVRHLVDRVVVLADGAIVFDDALARFLADPSLAAAAGLEAHGRPILEIAGRHP